LKLTVICTVLWLRMSFGGCRGGRWRRPLQRRIIMLSGMMSPSGTAASDAVDGSPPAGSVVSCESGGEAMVHAVTIGLDIAKSVFQVHGVDGTGEVVLRRQLRRSQVLPFFAKQQACLIGIEACASSHFWARELAKFGHQVRLIPPSYVKPYVKRQKNDAADA